MKRNKSRSNWLKVGITLFLLSILALTVYNLYPESRLSKNAVIDRLVVYKSKRTLLAYAKGKLLKSYRISLGGQPVGAKEIEGDLKTPEGSYYINDKNQYSGYHKNLGVSYPNEKDIAHAKTLGKTVGGDIKIHGLRNGMGFIGKLQRSVDWTFGCMALTNTEIDELYRAVPIGTPIEINP
ncbi:murein L,D-transpeptidase family protein [Sphingobacterium sp. BIGb0165]|uniref:L,D-transpeptidase family protein n=1 Tax=Sphingobacterium sp. BIGb0165 TaxID=2940615 RepID=UPI002168CE11|nr:L,D-transpeptidase family protein [Sphingobacterium sp. BIGb0165]MCS4224194.1 murein L,D-transpeptidase YafK [Sphingobacterium sp. BIGb0165]